MIIFKGFKLDCIVKLHSSVTFVHYHSHTACPLIVNLHFSGLLHAAYFDPHYGSLLLVTCQNSSLLVFNVNLCSTLPLTAFHHHHKFFQHMTPIKATWHPLFPNLVVVGRYIGGEENGISDRFVDVVDWEKGETVGRLRDMWAKGIVTVSVRVEGWEV